MNARIQFCTMLPNNLIVWLKHQFSDFRDIVSLVQLIEKKKDLSFIYIMASQRADEEIGASGALATELGTQDMGINVDASVVGSTTANPLATADPSSTGIPIRSTDNDVSELPPVEESTPNTPVTSPSILRQKGRSNL